MNRGEARAALEALFRDVFDNDEVVLTEDLDRQSFPSWDSLGHIRLVSTVEESFGVTFTIEEIESMNSVDRILDLIVSKS